jgi:hypothetical protein
MRQIAKHQNQRDAFASFELIYIFLTIFISLICTFISSKIFRGTIINDAIYRLFTIEVILFAALLAGTSLLIAIIIFVLILKGDEAAKNLDTKFDRISQRKVLCVLGICLVLTIITIFSFRFVNSFLNNRMAIHEQIFMSYFLLYFTCSFFVVKWFVNRKIEPAKKQQ